VDVAEVDIGEHRDDMTELALVDLTRPRTHRALGDPPRRVLAERDLAGVRIDPDAAKMSASIVASQRLASVLLAKVVSAATCLLRCQ
jgi:hypothetical protein